MLKKYRRRFVTLNMVLVGTVLLISLIFVGIYMYKDYYNEVESTMSAVLKPLNSSVFNLFDIFSPPENPAPDADEELRSKISTILYDAYRGRCSVISSEQNYSSDTIIGIVRSVMGQAEDFGKLRDYGVFYLRTGNGGDYLIAVTDISNLRESMLDLILSLLAVFVGAMVLFFFISRAISKMAVKPLEEAMQREKQFIADASHDLKTPLTVILANTEILREDPEASVAQQLKWIDSTADAAENMQRMIQEMLTLSKAEEGADSVDAVPVDFSAVVERSVLQLESVAYEEDISLDSELAEGLCVSGNESWLQRIAECLVGNAIQYEPKGGSVSVLLRESEDTVFLSVRNPGSDISPEDMPHIFERFYRIDKTRSPGGSHGLGLAIAKRMTEGMGGRIQVESGPGMGTRFTVSFPLLP